MKATFSSSQTRKGFTLIELIVVIAILGTLAALSYPVIMSFMDSSKRSASAKVCTDIVDAVTRFANDHNGMLPYDSKKAKADKNDQISLVTNGKKDANLIKIVSNREDDSDDRMNTSKEFYIRGDERDTPQDGLYVDASGNVGLYDPWGSPYYVILCEEENEGCIDPFTQKRVRGKSCIVYGLGPDQEGVAPSSGKKQAKKNKKKGETSSESLEELIEDNVYSWKKVK